MYVLGLLICLIGFPALGARVLTTQVQDIDFGNGKDDEVLVFLANGQVAKVRQFQDAFFINSIETLKKNHWYDIEVDENRYITAITENQSQIKNLKGWESHFQAPTSHIPTTISSLKIAQSYHREARYNPKESQCFNRAMVWSYEWWKKHNLKTNKLFIYFTRTYIRRYNFEWWFHVAPYVHVMENDKVVERVLDIKYANGPRKFQDWANIFLKNNASCQVIDKYSDYADFPYSGECFFQRTHMFTYQPADLQMYEAWGYSKSEFNMDEVRAAYLEAFNEKI